MLETKYPDTVNVDYLQPKLKPYQFTEKEKLKLLAEWVFEGGILEMKWA